jgi:hydrogenase maturation protease
VIGVGNPTRGDDIAGREVVRHLRAMCVADVCLTEMDGDAASLVPALCIDDAVWLVDASWGGGPPGTITRFDCAEGDVPATDASASSHGLGVAVALALARALGSLPRHCVLYAIEGGDFTPGAPPSPTVAKAATEVAERIATELRATATSP